MKLRIVAKFLSTIFTTLAVSMLFPLFWAWKDSSSDFPAFIFSIISALILAYFMYSLSIGSEKNDMGRREALACVAFSWIAASLIGALPFVYGQFVPTFTDAYFEAMSGFTTTGASIITDMEDIPRGILMWRAEMQWLGGMGIVVLVISVLPLFGINLTQLFKAESPGPTLEKVSPRIKEMATLLWIIYIGLTAIGIVFLLFGGMSLFSAIAHTFAAVSTGGYSIHSDSIKYYDSAYIDYVITILMFVSGMNFTLHFAALKNKTLKPYWRDSEFIFYTVIVLASSFAITASLISTGNFNDIFEAFRYASFQVVSIITTTGFATDNYIIWSQFSQLLLLFLMFVGGCAGSTSGAIKCIRIQVTAKELVAELKRMIHPNAVIPVFQNGKAVNHSMITNAGSFIVIFFIIWALSSLAVAMTGQDIVTSISAVSATLSNVGPGLANVGPECNFGAQHVVAKWIFIFDMLIGRLELYSLLILFTKDFWTE